MHSRERALITAAERSAVSLPRARHNLPSKTNDLAREAVGCNGVFGGIAVMIDAYGKWK
jgi:hypothetical protein